MAHGTWTSDWTSRLSHQINQMGFATIEDFLTAHPGEPYLSLVARIAPWVAALQLQRLQMLTARALGRLREAAMDALAREINDAYPNGWTDDLSTAASVGGRWAALVTVQGNSPELAPITLPLFRALLEKKPSIGWRPSSGEDPLIREVFDQCWPAH
jgi:hypothetical protein